MKKLFFFFIFFLLPACSPPFPPLAADGPISLETAGPIETVPSPSPAPVETAPPIAPTPAPTLEEKLGQLLICRFPPDALAVNDEARRLISERHIGGFTLFSSNVSSVEQVRGLTAELQTLSPAPLFIAIDEEGGRVSRIGKLYAEAIPPALRVGAGGPQAAYDGAAAIGGRLAALGINMDFAPVADVWANPVNTVIGDRAYGTDAETAAPLVAAAVRGLKDAGVLSVLKHFPGHGDTAEDSHHDIAVYPHDRARFDAEEAVPFLRGLQAGADGVMAGHIATPALQNAGPVLPWMAPWHAEGRLPATFSDYWLTDVLRGEFAYDGLVITDALDMGALTAHFTPAQIAVGAFLAGADILLLPADPYAALDALAEAYAAGLITDERLDASLRRIHAAKAGFD